MDSGFDPPDIHGVQPEDLHAVGFARGLEMRPQGVRIMMRLGVELPAKLIGVAGAGDDNLLAAEIHARDGEVPERLGQAIGARRLQASVSAS